MTKNQLTLVLVGVLFLSTLATVYLTQKFNSSTKQMVEENVKLQKMQNTIAVLQQLYNDSVEYGKKNPGIQPVLQYVTNIPATLPAKAPAK